MGNRIREVSLTEATPTTREIYQRIFGDRDPVAEPGTATGSRGDYWTTLAVVPDILKMAADTVFALLQPGRVLDPRYRELGSYAPRSSEIVNSNTRNISRFPGRSASRRKNSRRSRAGRPLTSLTRRNAL